MEIDKKMVTAIEPISPNCIDDVVKSLEQFILDLKSGSFKSVFFLGGASDINYLTSPKVAIFNGKYENLIEEMSSFFLQPQSAIILDMVKLSIGFIETLTPEEKYRLAGKINGKGW